MRVDMDLSIHFVAKVTAEANHGASANWCKLTFHDASGETKTVTVFMTSWTAADALERAINSANVEPKTIMACTVQAVQPECAA